MADTIERVTQVIHDVTQLPRERLTPDAHLRDELNVDSLLALQIVALLEKRFDIRVPDDEMGSHVTIREIAAAVEALKAQADADA